VITEQLFQDFPEKPEWELTDIRSSIVRGKNLALISSRLWFSKYLFLWKWEEQSWGRENPYLLANVVEAYIWAMYIDQGYLVTKQFILKHVYSSLDSILQSQNIKDFKTIFQEWSQSEYDLTPVYKVLEHSWPDHDKVFITWVFVWEKQMWEWKWSSKKKSQESAAESAYLQLKS
jgi:ribonuclease-3